MLKAVQTPTRDGSVLLAPDAAGLPALFAEARRSFARPQFSVANWPASRVRQVARREVGELIGRELAGPCIVTGHQAQMHHAGVWFKDAVISALAGAIGGSGVHLVSDLDTIKTGELVCPVVGAGGAIRLARVGFADPTGRHCPDQLPPPSAEQFESLVQTGRQAAADDSLFDSWSELARDALDHSATLAEWISVARNGLGRRLGVAVSDAPLSRLVRGQAFARFAADIILRAGQMHRLHADALREYRAARGIRNIAQPVPDLGDLGEALEVPLWAYDASGPRQALYAEQAGGRVILATPTGELTRCDAEPDSVAEAIAALASMGVRIAPRALTLTMFFRSFVADVFVHGIGGAHYDALGDELTERWYGWLPPPFITASATVRLDLPRFEVSAADLARAKWDAHHAWHNPSLYAEARASEIVDDLHRRKLRIAEEIQRAPRRGRRSAELYAELLEVAEKLRAAAPDALERVRLRPKQIGAQLAHNVLAAGREYFFAFAPRRKLVGLIAQARQWASSAGVEPKATATGCDRATEAGT